MNRHDFYELCVQSPKHLVPLLKAIHGGSPRILGEDFCGTAALSLAWVGADPQARAIGVDLSEEVLGYHNDHDRVEKILGDVRTATNATDHEADVVFVGNFSIGELHTRADLIDYLRHARSRVSDGGVFVCDTYGGESAFITGHVHRNHPGPNGMRIRYTWEQREADPTTGMVVNAMHFRTEKGGHIEDELNDAFVYHWRLWSVPELRDALMEAGFGSTQVFAKMPDAIDDEGNVYVQPVEDPGDLDENFIVCVVGRV